MKLSEIMELVRKANPSKYWKPRIWVPDPMEHPIAVFILSDKDFEIACEVRKFNKKLGAFSVRVVDFEGNRISIMYMRYHKTLLFQHELRHLQKGHFYE